MQQRTGGKFLRCLVCFVFGNSLQSHDFINVELLVSTTTTFSSLLISCCPVCLGRHPKLSSGELQHVLPPTWIVVLPWFCMFVPRSMDYACSCMARFCVQPFFVDTTATAVVVWLRSLCSRSLAWMDSMKWVSSYLCIAATTFWTSTCVRYVVINFQNSVDST